VNDWRLLRSSSSLPGASCLARSGRSASRLAVLRAAADGERLGVGYQGEWAELVAAGGVSDPYARLTVRWEV
jgi:hypothetical protein